MFLRPLFWMHNEHFLPNTTSAHSLLPTAVPLYSLKKIPCSPKCPHRIEMDQVAPFHKIPLFLLKAEIGTVFITCIFHSHIFHWNVLFFCMSISPGNFLWSETVYSHFPVSLIMLPIVGRLYKNAYWIFAKWMHQWKP